MLLYNLQAGKATRRKGQHQADTDKKYCGEDSQRKLITHTEMEEL